MAHGVGLDPTTGIYEQFAGFRVGGEPTEMRIAATTRN